MINLPIFFRWSILLAIFALPASVVSAVAAQEPESAGPIAVVSLAAYDQWHENVAMIGELSGSPDLAQGLEAMLKIATANRGAAGLDKTRPWMAALIPVGPMFTAYACLPVDDLDALIDVVRPLTADISTDRGTHKITLSSGQTIYVARRGDWAVVALDPTTVGRVPADPLALVGELPKKFDVAVRLHVARVPETLRAFVLAQVEGVVAEQAVRRPEDDDATYAGRRTGGRLALGMLKTALTELDEVTVGFALDRSARRLTAEVLLVPKDGTPAARRWNEYADRAPDESIAPRLRDAATIAFGSWSCVLSQPARDALGAWVETMRAESLRDFERLASSERVEFEKQVTLSLFEVARNLPAAERLEGNFGFVPRDGLPAMIAAVRLPREGPWTKDAERLALILGRYPGVNTDMQTAEDCHGKVRLYRISAPIAKDANRRETLVRQYGKEVELVLGIGEEHLYFATTRDGFDVLARALAASNAGGATPVPRPLECSLALAKVFRMTDDMLEGAGGVEMALDAEILEQSPGKDHIRLMIEPAERGIRVSLELEEGVLRLIGPAMGTLGGRAI
ncbi:MAG: hypothetical protein GX621_01665 [Pirellulaceae bacterium]|nr:hypothetical protein [Pirellulaceae bacterium]